MPTYKSYLLGFILSILLTFTAYFIVAYQLLVGGLLVLTIVGLAIIQLLVQLILFLHLGQEAGPRWKLAAWISTVAVILIIVTGSLWIMDNLSYHMMPADIEAHILQEEGIGK